MSESIPESTIDIPTRGIFKGNLCCYRAKPCKRPKCSLECFQRWSKRWAIIQRQSYKCNPPNWYVRLTPAVHIDEWRNELSKLKFRLLRRKQPIEWLQVLEWSPRGVCHVQLLLRCDMKEAKLRKILLKTKSLKSHYLNAVEHPIRVGKYVVKDLLNSAKIVLVPKWYRGRTLTYSRNYFAGKPRQLLKNFFIDKHNEQVLSK